MFCHDMLGRQTNARFSVRTGLDPQGWEARAGLTWSAPRHRVDLYSPLYRLPRLDDWEIKGEVNKLELSTRSSWSGVAVPRVPSPFCDLENGFHAYPRTSLGRPLTVRNPHFPIQDILHFYLFQVEIASLSGKQLHFHFWLSAYTTTGHSWPTTRPPDSRRTCGRMVSSASLAPQAHVEEQRPKTYFSTIDR